MSTKTHSFLMINQDGPVSPFSSPKLKRRLADLKPLKNPSKKKRTALSVFKYFMVLPYELKCAVVRFMGLRELLMLQRTCQLLRQITSENSVWKSLYCRHFNVTEQVLIEHGTTIKHWRMQFKIQYSFYNTRFLTSEKVTTCTTKPRTRFAHSAVTFKDRVYYIGGQMAEGRSDEIWNYNSKTNEFSVAGITNYDPKSRLSPIDVSEDCRNFEGLAGKVPSYARHQSAVIGHKVYTFGGYDYTYFYNLAVYNIIKRTWTYPKVTGDIPIPRSNHASVVVGNKFYIFGGSIGDNVDKYTVTNDFYCLDTKLMKWTRIPIGNSVNEPSKRVGHVMTAIGKHIYLFGGGVWGKMTGWTSQFNDLYTYNTVDNKWSLIPVKTEDKPPICTYPYIFNLKNNVCIFGGSSMTGSSVTNSLFMWDVLSRKWTELTLDGDAISPRSIGSASVVGNEIILWGGYCGGLLADNDDFFKLKVSCPSSVAKRKTKK